MVRNLVTDAVYCKSRKIKFGVEVVHASRCYTVSARATTLY